MGNPRTSREVALEVLYRVDVKGAWSGTLLRRLLDRAALSAVDGALATELALGTLRHQAEIDWALSQFAHMPLSELPSRIRAVLRLGAYQLLFLDRIPPAASCWETVEMAKRVGHPGTARLVNAVMRRLAAQARRTGRPPVGSAGPIPDDRGTAEGIALRYSHPAWLVTRWIERFGVDETRALCLANNETPPSAVRLNTLLGTPEDVAARLARIGIETVPSALIPEGRRITAGPVEARRRAHEAGWFTPQDEGSMLIARLVDPRPGETVIDACAAPGGKATHMAALMENRGRLIACDNRAAKLTAVSRQCARLGITIVEGRELDAAHLGAEYPGAADRVLVDAPCSGLGVLRRRPEIKWRIRPEQLDQLAGEQRRLLSGAVGAVRPGGVLIYSVCTFEPEEGSQVAEAFLERHPEFAPLPIGWWPTGTEEGAGTGTACLYPHVAGTDGFFVAAFRRVA